MKNSAMIRWWPVGVALLLVGGAVTVAVMRPAEHLPAGQSAGTTIDNNTGCPPICTKEAERARVQLQYPFYPIGQPSDAFQKLQWLADGVRCPVTDNVSLMASCVLQRYGKMRDKALSARARYDALVGLERAYWAALAREGLTQLIEHGPSGDGLPGGHPERRR